MYSSSVIILRVRSIILKLAMFFFYINMENLSDDDDVCEGV